MEAAAREERFEDAARLRDRIGAVERTIERQQIVGDPMVGPRRLRPGAGRRRGRAAGAPRARGTRDGRRRATRFSEVRLDDGDIDGLLPRPVLRERCRAPGPRRGALRCGDRGRRGPGGAAGRAGWPASSGADAEARQRSRAVEHRGAERGARPGPSPGGAREHRGGARGAAGAARSRGVAQANRVLRRLESPGQRSPWRAGWCSRSGQARKADYRRYKIRDARGGDDYACMREVVERRLARIETEPLPDLLMVDGGKGQLGRGDGAAARPRARGGSPGHREAARRGQRLSRACAVRAA